VIAAAAAGPRAGGEPLSRSRRQVLSDIIMTRIMMTTLVIGLVSLAVAAAGGACVGA
jgi:hypothetical protein